MRWAGHLREIGVSRESLSRHQALNSSSLDAEGWLSPQRSLTGQRGCKAAASPRHNSGSFRPLGVGVGRGTGLGSLPEPQRGPGFPVLRSLWVFLPFLPA